MDKETKEEKEIKKVNKIWNEIRKEEKEIGGLDLGIEQQEALIEQNEKSLCSRDTIITRCDNSFNELKETILAWRVDKELSKLDEEKLNQIYNLGQRKGRATREKEQINIIKRQAEENKSIFENEKIVHDAKVSELLSKLKIGVRE